MTLHKRIFTLFMVSIFLYTPATVFAQAKYISWDFSQTSYSGLTLKDNAGTANISGGTLQISKASGGTDPTATTSLDKACGDLDAEVFVIEMRFKSTSDTAMIYFQNSPNGGSILRMNQTNATTLRVSYGNENGIANDNVNIVTNFVKGNWYDLKFVFNNVQKRLWVYVDEQELVSNKKFFYNANVEYVGFLRSILLENNGTGGTMSFDSIVAYNDDDESATAVTKELLKISDSSVVESDLYLPMEGKSYTDISWVSSNQSYITNDGLVTRPTFAQGNQSVTLTATISRGSTSTTKQFDLVVPYLMTDEEAVTQDIAALSINEKIYDSFGLPAVGANGTAISWSVDRTDAVIIAPMAQNGIYSVTTNRANEDIPVVFTATIQKGSVSRTKTLSATVRRILTDEVCVQEDITEISLPVSVAQDFILPSFGTGGSSITWQSNNTDVIHINLSTAEITRLTVDTDVSLTATVTKGSVQDTKNFTVKVLKDIEGNTILLNQAMEALELNITGTVYDDITLPATGINGTTMTWKSADSDVVSNSGAVTRPKGANKTVNLTATVHKGVLTADKVFRITVKGIESGNNGGGGGSSGRVTANITMDTSEDSVSPQKPIEIEDRFSDVSKQHWAYEFIEKLAQDGIVNGTEEHAFRPENSVKREEFIKMIVESQGILDEGATVSFGDVRKDWYYPYIASAYQNGIISGISEDVFGIGQNITREQMAQITFRAAQLAKSESRELFGDDTAISPYAKEAVYALKQNNILSGNEKNMFLPHAFATRAEAAKLIYKIRQGAGR